MGNRPAFPVVSSIAKKLWIKERLQEVIAQVNGFILFMFIAGRFLVLKKWERNLNLSVEASVPILLVWALLYNVPVEFWTPKGLSYIASAIGQPLFADTTTLSRKRLTFARVCIEVEAGAPMTEEINLTSGVSEDPCLDPIKIRVVYQWKPT